MDCPERFTVWNWITAKMSLIGEDGITAVLAELGIEPDRDFSTLSPYEKDMVLAKCYFEQIMTVSQVAGSKDVDGNWQHQDEGYTVSDQDKARWKGIYMRLMKKWGETPLLPPSISLNPQGIKLWRRKL